MLEHLSISFDEFYCQKDKILFLRQNHPGIVSVQENINDDYYIDDMDLND